MRLMLLLLGFGLAFLVAIERWGSDADAQRAGLANAPNDAAAGGSGESLYDPLLAAFSPETAQTRVLPSVHAQRGASVQITPRPVVLEVPVAPSRGTTDAPATVEAAAAILDATQDLRSVRADAINVRGGPSTQNPVVGRLTRGESVRVTAESGDGWVKVVIEGDGLEGWVAERLLTR